MRELAASLIWFGLAISGPARASETPTAPPPPAAAVLPASPTANPADNLAAMARELERKPDTVVLMIESTPITQVEMADVVRTMPANFGNLSFAEVSRRALDVLVSQKAMALDARKDGLDKDTAVGRRQNAASDRVLADAWLSRQADAAVTDKALHDRYDRDVAGRPGPDEVRARVILLPTEAEARAVIAKAQGGEAFDGLARANSKAPNASGGGDLGYVTFDSLAPEIAPVVFALSPGQVSAFPVRSPIGWFVIRVEGRRQRGTPTFDQARPVLERQIRAETVNVTIESVLAHIKVVPTEKTGAPAR